jgi:flavin-dependent dehydrogenase
MKKIIIAGGGWSGCAAAISARKAGAEVIVLERTDMLLGTGLVGGIMRNNGRHTASEEMIAMGGGDLFEICDRTSRHKNVNFPGHSHASLYDIAKTHGEVMKYMESLGIKIFFNARITKLDLSEGRILCLKDEAGNTYEGDAFIDATGTAGPMNNCTKYGNGCAMCILRCPSFGGRVSITGLANIKEAMGIKADGSIGAMSGSCKLYKESLSEEIQKELKSGVDS